jgi:hypothetical protein
MLSLSLSNGGQGMDVEGGKGPFKIINKMLDHN